MSGRRVVLLGSLGVLVSVLSIGLAYGVAFAGNWNNNDNSYKAGDNQVQFHQCNLDLTANTHEAFHNNDEHDITPTNIRTYLYHGCDTVDVRINGYGYGFGADSYGYGWYECHVFYAPDGCDEGHVHINTSYSFIPEDYGDTLTVVCQEVGHSVGLGHRSRDNTSSCMSLVLDRSDLTARHLDSHDKDEINARY